MKRRIVMAVTLWLAPMLQIHAQEPPLFLLHKVKSIYVEPMPNGFDQSLIQKLLKWDAIRVVYVLEEADAVLKGGVSVRGGPMLYLLGEQPSGMSAESQEKRAKRTLDKILG